MRRSARIAFFLLALAEIGRSAPTYTIEQAVALAKKQNAEILIAAKQVEAARGGVTEARAGFLHRSFPPGSCGNASVRKSRAA